MADKKAVKDSAVDDSESLSTFAPRKRMQKAHFDGAIDTGEDEISAVDASSPSRPQVTTKPEANLSPQRRGTSVKTNMPLTPATGISEKGQRAPPSDEPSHTGDAVRPSIEDGKPNHDGNDTGNAPGVPQSFDTMNADTLAKHRTNSTREDTEHQEHSSEEPSIGELQVSEAVVKYPTTLSAKSDVRKRKRISDFVDNSGRQDEPEDKDQQRSSSKKRRIEQDLLHLVIQGRGDWSFMPTHWEMHFKEFPLPDAVWYVKVSDTLSYRPRIYAHTEKSEYEGTKKMKAIAYIHSTVRDIREDIGLKMNDEALTEGEKSIARVELGRSIVKKVQPVLGEAQRWCLRDGDLLKYRDSIPSNVLISELSAKTKEDVIDEIQAKMVALAQVWRSWKQSFQARESFGELEKLPDMPIIYGFMIIEQNVLITHMDTSEVGSRYHTEERCDMSSTDYQLWNMLAIMVTLCWARDRLMVIAEQSKLPAVALSSESDHDL